MDEQLAYLFSKEYLYYHIHKFQFHNHMVQIHLSHIKVDNAQFYKMNVLVPNHHIHVVKA
jgi:hypothetical protein